MPEKYGDSAAKAVQEANNSNKKHNDKLTWVNTNIIHTSDEEDNNYNKGSLFERKKAQISDHQTKTKHKSQTNTQTMKIKRNYRPKTTKNVQNL